MALEQQIKTAIETATAQLAGQFQERLQSLVSELDQAASAERARAIEEAEARIKADLLAQHEAETAAVRAEAAEQRDLAVSMAQTEAAEQHESALAAARAEAEARQESALSGLRAELASQEDAAIEALRAELAAQHASAVEALRAELAFQHDAALEALRAELAAQFSEAYDADLGPQHIAIGLGSTQLTHDLFRTLLDPGDTVISCHWGFFGSRLNDFAHRVGAVATTITIVWLVSYVLRRHGGNAWLARPAILLGFLLLAQVTLGAYVVWTARDIYVNSLHVMTGALVLATSLVVALRAHRARFEQPEQSRRRTAVAA